MSLDHAWMKGVPMDLRPRYFPKPPLKFKEIDIYIPLDAIENDYDFTEERRVLAECKMWEEEKEKERLAEEERQRLLAEETERLKIEEEERKEQERVMMEASAAAAGSEELTEDQNTTNDKVHVTDNKIAPEDDSGVVPNHSSNSSSSKPNSPVSEEGSSSQPQSGVENENAIQAPPQQTLNHPQIHAINGYHYMMNSDLQMNMYHQLHQTPVPHYYNYYVPPPHPQQVLPQHQQQQPPSIIQQHQQHGNGTLSSALTYPSNPQNSGCGPPQQHIPTMLQPTPIVSAPTSLPPSSTTPCQQPATPAGADSGTNSPAGSEKSCSGQNQPPQATQNQNIILHASASNKKVDLKDLSDFESDTANPFDNVELKSINDMEVLASVLKNHVPNPQLNNQPAAPTTATPTPDSRTSTSGSSTFVNGSGGGYYHQPTPIYPPVSSQCPYPTNQSTWNTNGYYPSVSVSSPPVSTTSVPTSATVPQPPPQQSHIPSPTQALEQPQSQTAPQAPPDSSISGVNSFTKLHFPFLTSMAASSSRGNRDNYGSPLLSSNYNRSFLPQSSTNSTDDFTSQNPFLSSYVQSHSPLHQHQYWPSHLSQVPPQSQNPFSAHTAAAPVQNGLTQSASGTGFIPSSGPSTAPPTGSQHALR